MSVLSILKDSVSADGISIYHRAMFILYTCMTRIELYNYIRQMKLMAKNRQKTFFKIFFEIRKAPAEMKLFDWFIVNIILKSESEHSLNFFINFFCKSFPTDLRCIYHDVKKEMFMCRAIDEIASSFEAFKKLSKYISSTQDKIIQISEEFREKEPDDSNVVGVLIELASRFKLTGGHWLILFCDMEMEKREKAIDFLLYSFLLNDKLHDNCNRFAATVSKDHICVNLGNEFTRAAVDASIMLAAECTLRVDKARTAFASPIDDAGGSSSRFVARTARRPTAKRVDILTQVDDPTVLATRNVIDELYDPRILGPLVMKYKLDVVSHCCIQRGGSIKPTVYSHSYFPSRSRWLHAEKNNKDLWSSKRAYKFKSTTNAEYIQKRTDKAD